MTKLRLIFQLANFFLLFFALAIKPFCKPMIFNNIDTVKIVKFLFLFGCSHHCERVGGHLVFKAIPGIKLYVGSVGLGVAVFGCA